jgi:CHAT domain-containing protein/tetratricopeptide (TPR) repeat protein
MQPGFHYGLLATTVLVACLTASGLGFTQAAEVLGEGDRRERELAPGQVHAYAVDVQAGQFLYAVVTPRGIDVAAALVAPDGRELLAVDMSADESIAEPIMFVAEASGRHEIRVRTPAAGVPSGQYAVRIEALHSPTPDDAARVRAMRTLEGAMRLRTTLQPKAMEEAIAPLAAARAAFHQAGDRRNETRAARETAGNLMNLMRPAALDAAREAVALARELGDDAELAKALAILGNSHERRGDMQEALAFMTESLALSRAVKNRREETATLNLMGIVYGRSGDVERAVQTFQQSLAIARAIRFVMLESYVLGNLGIATKDLGDYRLSLTYYEQALALVRQRGDRSIESGTLNNLGNLYRILGEHDKALAAHQQALTISREVGNKDSEARSLNTIGSTLYQMGDIAKALDYHEQSLALRRQLGDVIGQGATLDGIGRARHRLGESDRAMEALHESLRLRRETAERLGESDTLLHLALVERDRGMLPAAAEHLEEAVRLTETMRSQFVNPDLRASFVAAELERHEAYIDVLMQLHGERPGEGFERRALEASERSRARVLLESLVEAKAQVRHGIDPALLDRERASQRQLEDASARLSRLLARRADEKELTAARTAFETVTADYRQLQVRIRQESPAYAALTQPRPLTTAAIQRDLLDADTVLLEYALGDKRSWVWAVTKSSLAGFELPSRGAIESAARGALQLLTARQPRPGDTAAARSARVANADREWGHQSIALGRMLLGPAAAHLGNEWRGKRIVVVAANALQYVPFSALADPAGNGAPLVVDHEVANLPSASVLAVIREQTAGRARPPKTLAVFADPVFDADDPRVEPITRTGGSPAAGAQSVGTAAVSTVGNDTRGADAAPNVFASLARLPFSREEARALAALVPADQRFEATGFDASRANAVSETLAGYSFVHLATHGVFSSDQPERSGLVFSQVDRHGALRDGFLRVSDVYNLRLPAEVVVLSGCQTALGKDIKGEGLVGLTRGFMYAGARRVVASLWNVDDLATAELMRAFYRGMLKDGLRPAAALHAAQRDLARQPRWSSPYFWSGFVLQGEWQ